MEFNQIIKEILDSAYKVHSKLGPGLLESAYKACLAYELRKKGLKVEEENLFQSFTKKLNSIVAIEWIYWLKIR